MPYNPIKFKILKNKKHGNIKLNDAKSILVEYDKSLNKKQIRLRKWTSMWYYTLQKHYSV